MAEERCDERGVRCRARRARFIFRRQFILGPKSAEETYSGWKTVPLKCFGVVQAHEDLPVSQVREGGLELTLLGFVLDPDDPTANDREIIKRLVKGGQRPVDLIHATARLGGRWVMICLDDRDGVLFTDPFGLREVFFSTIDGVRCASQFGHLAKALNLHPDPTIDSEFSSKPYARTNPEYSWPGSTTPFAEIRHLTPNHFLDLRTGQTARFWPTKPLHARRIDDVVSQGATLMTSLVRAGHNRFPLALPITAGYDSRTILAAARAFASELWCYTVRREGCRLSTMIFVYLHLC